MNSTFKHPKPFYLIFSIEMWERFGFYGMQALLVLFMVEHLKFSDTTADNLFSAFSALVYAFVVVGGFIGDKVFGTKRTMFAGACFLCLGYLMLGLNSDRFLYAALGTIVAGNALFKANPSALVSRLYSSDDPRLDGAFTLYYMAINIGSMISMLLCPFVKRVWGWNVAFIISFFGMLIAMVNYTVFRRVLRGIGSDADAAPFRVTRFSGVIGVAIGIAALSAWLLRHLIVAHSLLYVAVAVVLVIYGIITVGSRRGERVRFVVCFILMIEAMLFFVLYQQMPTSLNLFTVRNTHHFLFGIPLEPASFQALNPLWIMIASPIMADVYRRLGEKGRDLSMPSKFASGMFLCALGFLVLYVAANFFADKGGIISGNWLFVTYGLQSLGELLISGLGLAMVAKLVPKRHVGFMMGMWFMLQATGFVIGGYVASLAGVPEGMTDPLRTLPVYTGLFLRIGVIALACSALMGALVPILGKHAR